MIDDILLAGIARKGENVDDPEVIAKYAAVAEKPAVLTKVPSAITLQRVKLDVSCGIAADFIGMFRRFSENTVEMGRLQIGNANYVLDPDVFYTIKTVAYMSANKSQNKAMACRDVFLRLVNEIKSEGSLTKGKMYEVLSEYKPVDYYASELTAGILIGVYKQDESVYYFSKRAMPGSKYKPCFDFAIKYVTENFKTKKEVDDFVNKYSKLARADKEFMGQLQKKTSKYLYAFMYAFGKEHPEILREFYPEKGFL